MSGRFISEAWDLIPKELIKVIIFSLLYQQMCGLFEGQILQDGFGE